MNPPNIQLEKDTAATILTCILHSHILNMSNPGSYNDELNKALQENNLPTIKLPPNPPSTSIFNLANSDQIKAIRTITQGKTEKPATTPEAEESSDDEQEQEEEEEEEDNEPKSAQENVQIRTYPAPRQKIQSKNIGLKVYTKRAVGWPTKLSNPDIVSNIQKGIYKYTFTASAYQDQEILTLIQNNDIDLAGAYTTVDNIRFKKLHSGLEQEKTLLPTSSKTPRPRQ